MDLVDRGSNKHATTKATLDVPKIFLYSVTLLLTAICTGAYRDGMVAVSSNADCPAGLVALINGLVAEVTSTMHPAFARQSSEDTVGFAHMLVRYLGQLPAATGAFSCTPLAPESQQMVVTFLRDCLTRHYAGLDLHRVTHESLSSDMATAVTRELVSRADVASPADNSEQSELSEQSEQSE